MNIAIKFENVSKQYRLGEVGTGTLSHDLHRILATIRGKPDPFLKVGIENKRDTVRGRYVWALDEVSFDVQQGEVIGIVGSNGAGKSTLLKLLSRIMAPTSGAIKTRGRIASLLEVGTGFHPELTGRENIFLNGAILGMSRREIARQLDAMIDFSGCAKYIDTPVKRYSSGMSVRLGFAVAAHLECEILVVDEVLAVGDAGFQKLCLGKMKEISEQSGRTVLFVSHNMQAVKSVCQRAVLLQAGRVQSEGSAAKIVEEYLSCSLGESEASQCKSWGDIENSPGNDHIRLHSVSVTPGDRIGKTHISMDDSLDICIAFWNLRSQSRVGLNIELQTIEGGEVLEDWSVGEKNWGNRALPEGLFRTSCRIPANLLNAGNYELRIVFFNTESITQVADFKQIASFTIVDDVDRPLRWHGRFKGIVHPKLEWATEFEGAINNRIE